MALHMPELYSVADSDDEMQASEDEMQLGDTTSNAITACMQHTDSPGTSPSAPTGEIHHGMEGPHGARSRAHADISRRGRTAFNKGQNPRSIARRVSEQPVPEISAAATAADAAHETIPPMFPHNRDSPQSHTQRRITPRNLPEQPTTRTPPSLATSADPAALDAPPGTTEAPSSIPPPDNDLANALCDIQATDNSPTLSTQALLGEELVIPPPPVLPFTPPPNIMTFNMRGIGQMFSESRTSRVNDLKTHLLASEIDIVFMQEARSTTAPAEIFRYGLVDEYSCLHSATPSENGMFDTCILVRNGLNAYPALVADLSSARQTTVRLEPFGLLLVNVHAPTPADPAFFQNLEAPLWQYAAAGYKLVLGGDFNVALTAEDRHNQPDDEPGRAALQELVSHLSLADFESFAHEHASVPFSGPGRFSFRRTASHPAGARPGGTTADSTTPQAATPQLPESAHIAPQTQQYQIQRQIWPQIQQQQQIRQRNPRQPFSPGPAAASYHNAFAYISRLDYLFLSLSIAQTITPSAIKIWTDASDHCMLSIILKTPVRAKNGRKNSGKNSNQRISVDFIDNKRNRQSLEKIATRLFNAGDPFSSWAAAKAAMIAHVQELQQKNN
ncbi:hypothetical protein EV177_003622 [Coemansia sp. RSA 1804]|nr:hypothetical protein EV177_003622 [Coemansia sp. RSA 1804]